MRHLYLVLPVAVLTACSSFKGEGPHYDQSYSDCYNPCSSTYAVASHGPHMAEQPASAYVYGNSVPSQFDYSNLAHGQTQYTGQPSYQTPSHQNQAVQYHTMDTPQAIYPDMSYGGYADTTHGPVYYETAKPKKGPFGLRGTSSYLYGNLGGIAYDVGEDNFGVVTRLGYQSPYYIGAEVEGTLGVSDIKTQNGADSIKGGVDYSVAAFALARLPLGERFSVHARGGYHVSKIGAQLDDGTSVVSGSESFDGFAYGGGAEFNLSPKTSMRVDYTRYELDAQTINSFDAATSDSVSWAIARKF